MSRANSIPTSLKQQCGYGWLTGTHPCYLSMRNDFIKQRPEKHQIAITKIYILNLKKNMPQILKSSLQKNKPLKLKKHVLMLISSIPATTLSKAYFKTPTVSLSFNKLTFSVTYLLNFLYHDDPSVVYYTASCITKTLL